MKKMRIRDEAGGARGGLYIFVNPEDGHRIEHGNVGIVIRRALEYRRLNNYPITSQWDDDVVQNICAHTPEPSCVPEGETPSMTHRAMSFASAMAQWVAAGLPVRDKAELERVSGICQSCEYYGGSRSIFRIACKKCSCSGLKQYLQTSRCPAGKW